MKRFGVVMILTMLLSTFAMSEENPLVMKAFALRLRAVPISFLSPVPKATVSVHSVSLTWAQSTTVGVTGNNVYRAAGASCTGATVLSSTATPIISYVDSGLPAATTYSYAVSATCATCSPTESPLSVCVTATTKADAPNAPTGLVVTGVN